MNFFSATLADLKSNHSPNIRSDAKALKSIEIYDPLTARWSAGPAMVDRRAFHQSAVVDGKVFFFDIKVYEP